MKHIDYRIKGDRKKYEAGEIQESHHNMTDLVPRKDGKNQVHGLIYLIACRYPDLMIDDGADSWLIPAGDAEKAAEFIFRMIYVKHAGMNSNKI